MSVVTRGDLVCVLPPDGPDPETWDAVGRVFTAHGHVPRALPRRWRLSDDGLPRLTGTNTTDHGGQGFADHQLTVLRPWRGLALAWPEHLKLSGERDETVQARCPDTREWQGVGTLGQSGELDWDVSGHVRLELALRDACETAAWHWTLRRAGAGVRATVRAGGRDARHQGGEVVVSGGASPSSGLALTRACVMTLDAWGIWPDTAAS